MSTITETPTMIRARHLAAEAGSKATTARGIIRAAIAYYPHRLRPGRPAWPEIPEGWEPDGHDMWWHDDAYGTPHGRYRQIALSDKHRDAARLADRPREAGAIRGAITRWQRADAPTLAEWDRITAERAPRIREARLRLARADAWAEARPRGLGAAVAAVDRVTGSTAPFWWNHAPVVVPGLRGRLTRLGGHSGRERRELSPRSGVSWEVEPGVVTEVVEDQDHEAVWADSGRPCHRPDLARRRDVEVRHASHILAIRSVAYIRDDGALDWAVGMRSGTLTAPDGWAWDVDDEGIHLGRVDGGADYHPDYCDLLAGMTAESMAEEATAAERIRAEEDRQRAEAAASVAGVWVCWDDARRAGHCAGGIREWCRSHHVDPSRHHPAEILIRRHGDDSRIQRIVSHAQRRHAEEVERGYALMADHGWPAVEAAACA